MNNAYFKEKLEKIRRNHGLMMIICCAVPLVLLTVSVKFFGLNNKYLVWFMLLLCPLMHFFMMKDMHKKQSDGKKGEGCH